MPQAAPPVGSVRTFSLSRKTSRTSIVPASVAATGVAMATAISQLITSLPKMGSCLPSST
jgi:hypothetical protein